MKKVLLIISIGCMLSATAVFAQTSASVLSPGTPIAKFSMSDATADQSSDASAQTQTAPQTQTSATATSTAPTTKDKKVKDAKKDKEEDVDHDHFTCTKDGCTHHHAKDQPCCKKDEKPAKKPTFMTDPNAPKKD